MELARLGFVSAHAARPTPIYVGDRAVTEGDVLPALLRAHAGSRHVLVADDRVYRIYGERLIHRLRDAGLDLTVCRVAANETSKSATMYLRLVERILRAGVDKESHILTFGGGVVSNVGGFVAATVFRGLPLIHLPSSLMAQLDAAVDVRQAINHGFGKNLVGAMYSPKAVLIDPSLLATLPLRHLRSGLAEAIKHALTQSRPLWRYLHDHAAHVRDHAFLRQLVEETVRLKLALLTRRAAAAGGEFLLQYGHCIGHAIEAATRYRYSHGEAIAIGMTVSAQISVDLGFSAPTLVGEHHAIFRAYGLPSRLRQNADVDAIVALTLKDKNVASKTPRMAVLRRIGSTYRSASGPFVPVTSDFLRRHLIANRTASTAPEEPCRS